jgi:hypothetical protein
MIACSERYREFRSREQSVECRSRPPTRPLSSGSWGACLDPHLSGCDGRHAPRVHHGLRLHGGTYGCSRQQAAGGRGVRAPGIRHGSGGSLHLTSSGLRPRATPRPSPSGLRTMVGRGRIVRFIGSEYGTRFTADVQIELRGVFADGAKLVVENRLLATLANLRRVNVTRSGGRVRRRRSGPVRRRRRGGRRGACPAGPPRRRRCAAQGPFDSGMTWSTRIR